VEAKERKRDKNTQTNIIKQKKHSERYPWLATHKEQNSKNNKRNAASFLQPFFFFFREIVVKYKERNNWGRTSTPTSGPRM
jgi:hypothetical protein